MDIEQAWPVAPPPPGPPVPNSHVSVQWIEGLQLCLAKMNDVNTTLSSSTFKTQENQMFNFLSVILQCSNLKNAKKVEFAESLGLEWLELSFLNLFGAFLLVAIKPWRPWPGWPLPPRRSGARFETWPSLAAFLVTWPKIPGGKKHFL